MDKVIPISIVAVIIILGFITKCIELNAILKRIDFTNGYRNKFIDLVNGIMSHNTFNQQLYYEYALPCGPSLSRWLLPIKM